MLGIPGVTPAPGEVRAEVEASGRPETIEIPEIPASARFRSDDSISLERHTDFKKTPCCSFISWLLTFRQQPTDDRLTVRLLHYSFTHPAREKRA